jgi:RNA polymerase sigma factor (TIGR02999 family)
MMAEVDLALIRNRGEVRRQCRLDARGVTFDRPIVMMVEGNLRSEASTIEPAEQVGLGCRGIQRGEDAGDLLPLVYDELRRLAMSKMNHEAAGQTLQATALVHEAWLRLVGNGDQPWDNRAHFFAAAAEAMRRILIENVRRKSRLKRGGDFLRVDLPDVELADTTPDDKILLINEALEEMETREPEKARVVVLKFFGGMSNKEVAESMGVNERTIERHWAFAKAWLYQKIRSQDGH